MAIRSIWSGHVTFGLVSIPVGIYSATEAAARVHFRQLHEKDKAPIRYKKFCSKEDVEVPNDEIVRGYETGKGRFAIVKKEELDEVQEEVGEGDHTVEIVQFVEPGSLNPLLFETPYYLAPREGGAKAYAILRSALHETGRVGIARFYLRTRPLLAALMPAKRVLALAVMRPPDELRSPDRLDLPADATKAKEVEMARALIDRLSGEWDPTAHPNVYRKAMEKLLARKRAFELPAAEERPSKAKVVDLMEALKQSLARKGAAAPKRTKGGRRTRAA